ncbi:hypothetical protein FA10DRAFT_269910 [Acaromyces ingoldii]|uniref:H-type lectin domain-containing protein n=1 Tax=Acaromyces ingoldii TaxID=215250 RepID=A0A316YDS0_9BASI|nr:hypothetical protein FA10DRAFT_269910 [Acaromyces ingoldii]PWN86808.1 hypothetical protein FA10DRAFT_269910 [Acaromyces ingoldii]
MVDISMESDLTFLCLPTKVTDVGYTMGLTKGPATQVYSMKANFIGFRPGDRRVQTGRYSFAEGRKKTDPNGKRAFMPSESHTLEVEFKVAYKTTPKVVCAIDHVQRFLKLSVRARAWAENITPTGFRLRLATFDNSAMIQLGVSWLAHDSTDDTIRSGNFNCSDDLRDLRTEISGTATFDRPFPQRPRELFAAFSRFDVPPTKQLRISCETPLWTERDVQYKLRTWKDESAFCGLEGIYVALL